MKLMSADGFEKLITKKLGKSLDDYRPEITFRAILSIIDSPLCKTGKVKFIVKTKNGEILDFKPTAKVSSENLSNLKLPRSEKRFKEIIASVLEKKSLVSEETEEVLI